MIAIADLPHVNAALNALTIVLLGFGYHFIRNGERDRHKACMLAAVVVSGVFLVSYLTYHFNSGLARFGGEGWIRPVYFTILIAHVLGAVVVTVLVPVTLFYALSSRFQQHRRVARWTWPLWMYVAISGVVVYVMAVQLFPFEGGPYGGG